MFYSHTCSLSMLVQDFEDLFPNSQEAKGRVHSGQFTSSTQTQTKALAFLEGMHIWTTVWIQGGHHSHMLQDEFMFRVYVIVIYVLAKL